MSRKAQKKALMTMVIILFSTVLILIVLGDLMSGANKEADETQCRLSVMQRALNPIDSIYSSPLMCTTSRVDLSDDAESSEKDEYTRQVAELSMDCWNMFGKGVLRTMQDSDGFASAFGNWFRTRNFFGIYEGEALCFVCYDIRADFPEDDMEITEPDILSFMENEIYVSEDSFIDICEKEGIEDQVECNERRDEISHSPCEMRGGECSQQCDRDQLAQTDAGWECENDADTCCVSKQNAYSYYDYLRYDSSTYGRFQLYSEEGAFKMEEGERYGVMYVEPIDADVASHIVIANMDEAEMKCTVRT
ncbi:MAG: hypothetical protein ACLFNK_00545 [Candidatus Woesearchaeota archaeon]